MRVLALETSCDETAAAVVESGTRILSNVVASQIEIHRPYGGVVPEIAARAHEQNILPTLEEALTIAGCEPGDIDGLAVTQGPGLVGALLIGLNVAKALALTWSIPLVGVNHLEAHIYANFLGEAQPHFPFLALVASGGHSLIASVEGPGKVNLIGETLDDAAGEAFDKISKYMGWGYPGGPSIDRLARMGDAEAVHFPRALMVKDNYDFSYSGVKTAVGRYVEREMEKGRKVVNEDIAASFEAAAVEVLVVKTVRAAKELGLDRVVFGGGVVANTLLRKSMREECAKRNLELHCPPADLCTDNAAMVASLGYYLLREGRVLPWEGDAVPDLSFEGSETIEG